MSFDFLHIFWTRRCGLTAQDLLRNCSWKLNESLELTNSLLHEGFVVDILVAHLTELMNVEYATNCWGRG